MNMDDDMVQIVKLDTSVTGVGEIHLMAIVADCKRDGFVKNAMKIFVLVALQHQEGLTVSHILKYYYLATLF